MRVVVITDTPFFAGEAEAISRLLESGAAWRVHLRKPGCFDESMRALIEAVPAHLHPRLSLHDCHSLAAVYGCGVHLNARCPDGVAGVRPLSRSCHSLDELEQYGDADYLFLSPVYDSISKQGYRARFSLDDLRGHADSRTVALGGVKPACIPELARAGFGGAAMLGYVWRDFSMTRLETIIEEICSSL